MQKIVVISPHLDDAVLSMGGTISRLVARGYAVVVVTIFANDLENVGPPSRWDASRQITTAAAASAARRVEDAKAAKMLGFEAVWLPFDDISYISRRDPDEIWDRLGGLVDDAWAVFAPGYPLWHEDHRYATALVMDRIAPTTPLAFYEEQPYSGGFVMRAKTLLRGRSRGPSQDLLPPDMRWTTIRLSHQERASKASAIGCYKDELPKLGFQDAVVPLSSVILKKEAFAARSGPTMRLLGAAS